MSEFSLGHIKERLKNNFEINYRDIGIDKNIIHIIYDNSICSSKLISEFIISPLIININNLTTMEKVKNEIILSTSIGDVLSEDDAIEHILSGDVILIFDFLKASIYCEAKSYIKRSITIPPTESVLKGPREGFNEILNDNISCIRRRIKDSNLKFENIILGEKSKTSVALAYIEGNAPEKLICYIRKKVNKVSPDFIIYSNQIEEGLKCKRTPFDTVGYTEKPDIIAQKLGEGKVAILVDGTPFVSVVPFFFIENFQAPDDYTMNKFVANLGILLRFLSFFISTLLPGLYIALFTYHFNLIPYIFVFRMAESRAGVPFPMIVEVILLIIFFQILREAGVRLPQPIGPTLSIVGALILGDAVVKSGLASHVTVLVVALTSISSFLLPTLSVAIFIWNLVLLIFSASLGLPGFYTGFVLLCSHLAGLTSCGYPYLYPLGTLNIFKYKGIIFRGDLDKINEYIFIKDDDK